LPVDIKWPKGVVTIGRRLLIHNVMLICQNMNPLAKCRVLEANAASRRKNYVFRPGSHRTGKPVPHSPIIKLTARPTVIFKIAANVLSVLLLSLVEVRSCGYKDGKRNSTSTPARLSAISSVLINGV
jgi:hypothetical protein